MEAPADVVAQSIFGAQDQYLTSQEHADMARRIGRARAEARIALAAVRDNAGRYFVMKQIEKILEALQ